MQDNNNRHLADRGWQSMELILDKEMPQHKKRRFMIWWLLGGAVVLLSVMMMYLNTSEPSTTIVADASPSENVSVTKEQPIENTNQVSTELPVENKLESPVTKSKETNPIVEPTATKVIDTKTAKYLKTQQSKAPERAAQKTLFNPVEKESAQPIRNENKPNIAKNEIGAEQNISKTIAALPESKTSNSSEAVSPSTNTEKITENTNTTQTNEKLNPVNNDQITENKKQKENIIDLDEESRELLDFQLIPVAEGLSLLSFQRDITIVAKEEKKNYWYANVGGAGLWNPSIKLTGLSATSDFGYSFNDRFNLGLTVGTGSFKYAQDIQDQTAINVAGRMTFSESEANNVLRSSFMNASFLELGIHGGLGITNKLRLRADVGYQYFYTSMFDNNASQINLDVADTPEDTQIDVSGAGGEAGGTKGAFNDLDFSLAQKWFPSMGLGLDYRYSDKLSVGVSYNYVSGELFELSSRPLSMNRLRIGFRYRFFQSSKHQK